MRALSFFAPRALLNALLKRYDDDFDAVRRWLAEAHPELARSAADDSSLVRAVRERRALHAALCAAVLEAYGGDHVQVVEAAAAAVTAADETAAPLSQAAAPSKAGIGKRGDAEPEQLKPDEPKAKPVEPDAVERVPPSSAASSSSANRPSKPALEAPDHPIVVVLKRLSREDSCSLLLSKFKGCEQDALEALHRVGKTHKEPPTQWKSQGVPSSPDPPRPFTVRERVLRYLAYACVSRVDFARCIAAEFSHDEAAVRRACDTAGVRSPFSYPASSSSDAGTSAGATAAAGDSGGVNKSAQDDTRRRKAKARKPAGVAPQQPLPESAKPAASGSDSTDDNASTPLSELQQHVGTIDADVARGSSTDASQRRAQLQRLRDLCLYHERCAPETADAYVTDVLKDHDGCTMRALAALIRRFDGKLPPKGWAHGMPTYPQAQRRATAVPTVPTEAIATPTTTTTTGKQHAYNIGSAEAHEMVDVDDSIVVGATGSRIRRIPLTTADLSQVPDPPRRTGATAMRVTSVQDASPEEFVALIRQLASVNATMLLPVATELEKCMQYLEEQSAQLVRMHEQVMADRAEVKALLRAAIETGKDDAGDAAFAARREEAPPAAAADAEGTARRGPGASEATSKKDARDGTRSADAAAAQDVFRSIVGADAAVNSATGPPAQQEEGEQGLLKAVLDYGDLQDGDDGPLAAAIIKAAGQRRDASRRPSAEDDSNQQERNQRRNPKRPRKQSHKQARKQPLGRKQKPQPKRKRKQHRKG